MSMLSLKITDLMMINNIKNESELAKMIRTARADLSHFLMSETKNPNLKILKKIAEFFDLTVNELLINKSIENIYIAEVDRHHGSPGAVLRYLMSEIGSISEGELFRRTGVPQPTIHRILSGATPNPRMDSIEPLAKFFNVSTDQMLGRVPLPKDRILGSFLTVAETKKIVPLLNWQEIDFWPNILNSADFKVERNWVISESGIKGMAFALKIISTDYLPEFRRNTIIIIDSERNAKNGDFVLGILRNNGEPVLGQFSIEENARVFVTLSQKGKDLCVGREVDLQGVIVEARHNFN